MIIIINSNKIVNVYIFKEIDIYIQFKTYYNGIFLS